MSKVLIVDDSKLPRMALRKMLEPAGHVVIEATDGPMALTTFASERPDVVLLDMMLGTTSGLTVLTELRTRNPNVRVVVISGDKASATPALTAGAVAFIGKPFVPEQVLGAITAALGHHADTHGATADSSGSTVESDLSDSGDALDVYMLRDVCMNDAELERKFLTELLESGPTVLSDIERSLSANDARGVQAYAHAYKGNCFMLGVLALGAACADLEEQGRIGELGSSAESLARAQRELDRARRVVELYLARSERNA